MCTLYAHRGFFSFYYNFLLPFKKKKNNLENLVVVMWNLSCIEQKILLEIGLKEGINI